MKITFAGLRVMALAFALALSLRAAPQLGLQSWTCTAMTFEQTVEFAVRHRITNLQFYDGHFNPKGPKEETLRKLAVLKANGLKIYTFGVNATSLDKEENRKLFEFAKLIGAKLIVVEPRNPAEWDNLEELVREYDIRLAIHNHGTGTVYGDPATVKAVLAKRDRRIGVCLDVGWVTGAGFDAAEVFRSYGDRVFDIHLKDKKIEIAADGAKVVIDAVVGTGATNFAGLFAAIKETNWSGVMAIETGRKPLTANPDTQVAAAIAVFETRMSGK